MKITIESNNVAFDRIEVIHRYRGGFSAEGEVMEEVTVLFLEHGQSGEFLIEEINRRLRIQGDVR
jgi:hypothetical protein